VADQAHHVGALALEFLAEAHDDEDLGGSSDPGRALGSAAGKSSGAEAVVGVTAGAGSATPTGSPLQKSSALGPAERGGGAVDGEDEPPLDPPSRIRSKSERRMRTRRPTRTAGIRPWSIQLRTVCWLTLNQSATSATVKKDSSRFALIAKNFQLS
jgi:hypothetical protein